MIHYKLVHYTRISVKHCRAIRNVFSQNCSITPHSFTSQSTHYIHITHYEDKDKERKKQHYNDLLCVF